jgi:flagellar biosynthetic protein FliR
MELQNLETIARALLSRLDVGWTFLLLVTRYIAFLMVVPGIGGGLSGIIIRYPVAVLLAIVSLNLKHTAPVPTDIVLMVAQIASEVALGGIVGVVPLLIVSGAQTAGHLASGTMGLNGAQLFDPTTSAPLSDLARIYSDLAIVLFLLIGGHYVAIAELAGLDASIVPGSFVVSSLSVQGLVTQSSRIFQIGCLIAAPVVVALLLTNFVMGVVSKAIPTVNIFIVSFPLTIGIGFAISILALPEVAYFLAREFNRLPEMLRLILG